VEKLLDILLKPPTGFPLPADSRLSLLGHCHCEFFPSAGKTSCIHLGAQYLLRQITQEPAERVFFSPSSSQGKFWRERVCANTGEMEKVASGKRHFSQPIVQLPALPLHFHSGN